MGDSDLKAGRPIRAAAWDLAGRGAKQLSSFVFAIFLARLLTPAEFGLVAMATAFIVFSEGFLDIGFSSAIIQKKDVDDTQLSTIFFMNLMLGVTLTVLLWAASGAIGRFYESPIVTDIVRVLSFSFTLRAFTIVQETLLRKRFEHRQLTKTVVVSGPVAGTAAVIAAFLGLGVWSLVIKNYVGSLVRLAMLWKCSEWRPKLVFKPSSMKDMFRFGGIMFFSSMITRFFSRLDTFVIGKVFDASTLGYFYRAQSFVDLVNRFTAMPINSVFFPLVSHFQDRRERISRALVKSIHLMAAALFPCAVVLFVFAEPIIRLLFGEQWLPSVGIFRILVFLIHVSPFASLLAAVLSGTGRAGEHLRLELTKKSLQLLCVLIGLYLGGLKGYLVGLVLAGNLGLLLNILVVARVLQLRVWDLFVPMVGYGVLAISLGTAVYLPLSSTTSGMGAVIFLVLFATSYVALLFVLKAPALQVANSLRRAF
jgi:O-antigen/teichoic acid export membrane protein